MRRCCCCFLFTFFSTIFAIIFFFLQPVCSYFHLSNRREAERYKKCLVFAITQTQSNSSYSMYVVSLSLSLFNELHNKRTALNCHNQIENSEEKIDRLQCVAPIKPFLAICMKLATFRFCVSKHATSKQIDVMCSNTVTNEMRTRLGWRLEIMKIHDRFLCVVWQKKTQL